MQNSAPRTSATDGTSKSIEPELNRILVVISPDLVKPSAPRDSALLMRAVALAKAAGCELELFHVCHDASLRLTFLGREGELQREQQKLLERDATRMAELALRLRAEGVTIRYDVRWDHPRTDAILRKIDDAQPDLVMKQSREYGYVMGVLSNTDWDLIRQSPAHVWFVTDDGSGSADITSDIDRVVTAVGTGSGRDEIIPAGDYDVFRFANLIATGFGAENIAAHAYHVPEGLSTYAAHAPEFRGMSPAANVVPKLEETRREVAREHARSVQTFAESFELDPRDVYVAEGYPSDVLPKAADALNADLIVMAARNLSRWERVFRSVTAEPVLAETPCDVVFVKDRGDHEVPVAVELPVQGVPAFNLEAAITDPKGTFGAPQRVVQLTDVSIALRKRILQAWALDVEAQMVEDDEGGPIVDTNADILEQINLAMASLARKSRQDSDGPALRDDTALSSAAR